jgi:hypothetical protein
VWLATFVLFDNIKFELICSFDKHAVDFMIFAPVAEHQLLVFVIGQPRMIFEEEIFFPWILYTFFCYADWVNLMEYYVSEFLIGRNRKGR